MALASSLWAAPVETAVQADTKTEEKAAIERLDLKNDFIHLSLDLKARVYSIQDSRTGAILLEAAPIKVEMEKGAEVTLHREEAVSDAFGEGRRIILAVKDYGLYRYATHFRSGVPPRRLLSFTLYEEHPALILGFGLLTPNYYSIRLREAEVLSGEGKLFGGARMKHPLTLTGTDPFEALERYGLALRAANNASPNVHQSPVLCGWSVGNISKLPDINNSAKLVEEADHAQVTVDQGRATLEAHPAAEDLWVVVIDHPETGEVQWTVR